MAQGGVDESTAEPATTGPWGARPVGDAPAPARASVPLTPGGAPASFHAARADYARIMRPGLALYLPTLGFNRFWLKTDQRRFFWLNTSVGGDHFEYRGQARELVVGFLFAVAIYLPIAAAYSILGLYAESLQSMASVPFFLFTFAFGHYAAFRARRYRLTRTAFRGLRFWMAGSAWRLGLGAFGWLVATAITAGLAYPWMQAWIERYKMRHSSYGDLPGGFTGTGWGLAKAYVLPVVLGLAALGALVFALAANAVANLFVLGPIALLVAILILPLGLAVFSGLKMRWWINGVTFGEVRCRCDLPLFALVGPAFKAGLITMVFAAVWGVLGFSIGAGVLGLHGMELSQGLFTNFSIMIPALLWITAGLIVALYIKAVHYNFAVVQRLVQATAVFGLGALDGVTSQGTAEGAVGEGLADALGADGF